MAEVEGPVKVENWVCCPLQMSIWGSAVQEQRDKSLGMFSYRSALSTLLFYESGLPSCTAGDELSSVPVAMALFQSCLHSPEEWFVVVVWAGSQSFTAR